MTNVLVVDGNSLAHRAYHAAGEHERDGAFVTAGLVRMLATTWPEGPFGAVIVAFDDTQFNQRKLDWPEYKSNRDDKDELLLDQLDVLPEHLEQCGFHVTTAEGAEADDLVAAAADDATAVGWHCTVLSSDRDLLALVSETVTMLRPRGSMARLKAYDPVAVLAEFGVRPEQYTDFAALRGDPSDGLDGVTGIGPKTAARLLRDYGDVPGIYAALTNLPPKLEAALRADRERVERNLLLMAPLPRLAVDVAAAVADGVDLDRVTAALEDLGEPATAGIFRHAVTRPALPPMPPPPDTALPDERDLPATQIPDAVIERRERVTVPDAAEQQPLF